MKNMGRLIPIAMSLKEVLASCMDIEEFLKGTQDRVGKSTSEVIRDFLESGKMPDV